VGKSTRFAEPETPPDPARLQARINGVARSFRRRLTDRIEDLFEEACLSGDLETAEALLRAHATATARGVAERGRDRRDSGQALARLHETLRLRRTIQAAA
jgi:hypothetical protein